MQQFCAATPGLTCTRPKLPPWHFGPVWTYYWHLAENALMVAHRLLEMLTGYLIFLGGSPEWLLD